MSVYELSSMSSRLEPPVPASTQNGAGNHDKQISRHGDIAIVGIGCRFPGGSDPDAFWRLLRDGADPIRQVPAERWSAKEYFAPYPPKPGKTYSCWGGFLDVVDRFDAAYFGISPREVASIDPQQRLLLEVATEALDDAGFSQEWLSGRDVSVFIGSSFSDFQQMGGNYFRKMNAFSIAGSALSITSNRLSYLFNLRGPSLTVDTACSSSLVAFHYACESIRQNKAEAAIVGGVHLLLWPAGFVGFSQAHMLSPDGRCHSFDARANGYVRAEGAGVVVLKPLQQAIADGDTIYATVLGTGVNQDGRTAGMSVPSEDAQVALLRQLYSEANVTSEEVSYVEAHATGTAVGDPIEARAIGRALGIGHSEDRKLRLGSVKSNIGHLEPASGIAGIIKTVLAMKHQQLPRTLHFEKPNPAIDFDGFRMSVVSELEPWPARDGEPRIAGVNSFGFGGTNAHVILSDYGANVATSAPANDLAPVNRIELPRSETTDTEEEAPPAAPPQLVTLSAKSESGLQSLVSVWKNWLETLPSDSSPSFDQITYTAAARRTHHDYRLATVCSSIPQLIEMLDCWQRGEKRREIITGHVQRAEHLRTAFVFNGMGSQWQGMGEELYRTQPVFRNAVNTVDGMFQQFSGWSIVDRLHDDEFRSRMNETEVTQPCIFAVQVGLAAMWQDWGVEPEFVVGHSLGEVAAAYAAGVLSLDDAVRVIYHRSRLQHTLRGHGRMLALGIPSDSAEPLIAKYGGNVAIAAINSPSSVTLSGNAEMLEEIRQEMEANQSFCRFLQVDVPYHCDRMNPIRDELQSSLADLEIHAPKVPFFSTVTGDLMADAALGAEYWWRNVRQPVLFASAIKAMIAAGAGVFIEIGAHPVLMNSMVESAGDSNKVSIISSQRRGEDQRRVLYSALGKVFAIGHGVLWDRVYPRRQKLVRLPSYQWQRQHFAIEALDPTYLPAKYRAIAEVMLGHPTAQLLGQPVQSAQQERAWHLTAMIDSDHLWLADHRVQQTPVFPAAGYVDQMLSAARQLHPNVPLRLEAVDISKSLILATGQEHYIETVIDVNSGFTHIDSRDAQGNWTRHASGKSRVDYASWEDLQDIRIEFENECRSAIDPAVLYDQFGQVGLEYGPHFQAIKAVQTARGKSLAQIGLTESLIDDVEKFTLCPPLLDACMQLMYACLAGEVDLRNSAYLYLPAKIELLRLRDPLALMEASKEGLIACCQLTEVTEARMLMKCVVYDKRGRALVTVDGLEVVAFPVSRQDVFRIEDCLFDHRWELKPRDGEPFSDSLPSPKSLSQDAQSRATARLERLQFHEAQAPAYARLATAFAVNALTELGFNWQAKDRSGVQQLAEQLGVAPERSSLFRQLLKKLSLDGYLRFDGETVDVISAPEAVSPGAVWQEICQRWPSGHSEQILSWLAGTSVVGALRGQFDSSSVLCPGGSTNLLEQAEEVGPSFQHQNTLLQETVVQCIEKLPPARQLRILDLSGGAAPILIPGIPSGRARYVIAANAQELSNHRQKYRERPFVSFIEWSGEPDESGKQQDLDFGNFDLIICSNSQHFDALAGGCAPDTLLIFRDGPGVSGRGDLDEALGWYAFRVASDKPCVASLLAQRQFREVVELREAQIHQSCIHQLLIACPPLTGPVADNAAEAAVSETNSPEVWFVVADHQDSAKRLAQKLREHGRMPVLVSNAPRFQKIDQDQFELPFQDRAAFLELCRVFQADNVVPKGIIHLADFEVPTGDDVTTDDLRAGQRNGVCAALCLAQAVSESGWLRPPRVWLATQGTQAVEVAAGSQMNIVSAPIIGLARVLSNEMPQLKCTSIDLDDIKNGATLDSFVKEVLSSGGELEVAIRGSHRYVPRLRKDSLPPDPDELKGIFRIASMNRGSFDSLSLLPCTREAPAAGQVEIEVTASAVNFKDVAKVLRLLSDETLSNTWSGHALGLECAGRISAVGEGVTHVAVGDRVVALATDSFRPYVLTRGEFVARIPDSLSVEDAAGVPVVFLTAWFALHRLAHIQPGERVLIHAAAGGVGLAAIQVAKAAGAEVFATAGSSIKRSYLASLGVKHLFDSRSLSFVDDVKQVTGGEGVDVVLNSLTGPAIPASLSLLRPGGRFVEIGKRDIQENVALGLNPFQNNLSFMALDLDRLLVQRPEMARIALESVLSEFESGKLYPIPTRSFPASQAAEALKYVAKARQIGKVLLDMRDPLAQRHIQYSPLKRTIQFSPDATYLVTGGLTGFGMATAKWLVQHGARNLVLLSRRGPSSFEAQQDILELQEAGAQVLAPQVDVSNQQQLAETLDTIRSTMPPLKGVFHAAMVLDDAFAIQLSPERMEAVLAPKAYGAWNLHLLTREVPLDYFVLFSSATTVFGNPGQANYVAACSFLEQLAQHRRATGRSAISIAWGAIADVGYLTRNREVLKHLQDRLGFTPIPVAKALEYLEQVLVADRSHAALVAVNWSRFSPSRFAIAATPRMSQLVEELGGDQFEMLSSAANFREILRETAPGERRGVLRGFLTKSLANVLGASPEAIDTNCSLLAMGLDSLMAVELQRGLSRELNYEIPPMQLLRGPSIEELTDEFLAEFSASA